MILDAFRPEEQLLLRCVRTEPEGEQAEVIRVLLTSPLDWNYLLETTRHHRMIPLLYWCLKGTFAEYVPEQTLESLRTGFRDNTLRNLSMLHEIKSVTQILAQAGIPAVPFKGVVLALQAYHHTALRVCRDIDLMVQHKDLDQATDILLQNGYYIHHEHSGAEHNPLFERFSHHLSLVNSTNGLKLELHWRLLPTVVMDVTHFWRNANSTALTGIETLQFASEDLILLLLIHGSKHLWAELIWAADIDKLLRQVPEIDWDYLLALSQTWGVGRFVRVGILFCHTLLESPVPELVLTKCRRDQVAIHLCDHSQRSLFEPQSRQNPLSEYHADFQMRDTWKGKMRYVGYLLTNWKPSSRDVAFLPLPKTLRFLYPVVRLIRVPIQYMGGLIKSRKKVEQIYHDR